LELVETLLGRERRGSLLWVLDACATSMGARLLRTWLERPLLDRGRIEARHDAVEEMVTQLQRTDRMRAIMERVFDLPRLLSRCIYGTANARDLLALAQSLERLPELKSAGAQARAERLRALLDGLEPIEPARAVNLGKQAAQQAVQAGEASAGEASAVPTRPLEDLRDRLLAAIHPECPATVREGNLILTGWNAELDELRDIRDSGRARIRQMEDAERERTGIKSLKIGYNSVFGYYIEVTKSNLSGVPSHYVRKQTIANGERYINEELKAYEEKILGADERIKGLEYELFSDLVREVAARQEALRGVAERLAEIDVLCSLAHVAARNGYVRPTMTDDSALAVEGGRHPVVERVTDAAFVPNDLYVDGGDERLLIITGPNMAGKSTYLRQVALMSVMAQIGSFVPARTARLGIVDRVFTRVGASDDLHLGQSTFFVEMSEAANILNNATARSLVILDEIGRGTSTFDGLSIAWSVAEYLHDAIRCKTLFATHFHELTALEGELAGARAYRVAVKENRDDVVFLHRILRGGSDKSYGIYVARLAGVPVPVLDRAREVLAELERERHPERATAAAQAAPRVQQLTLFDAPQHPLLDEIRQARILELTPLAALNLIHEWQKRLL
ncbi:MAG: DNA mismatch repair protein MutS, partial [Armatimonadetes bacterium]|nr:DNA mismatch repair protein MutS [Armatimonadota bacterium]